jgi:sporulation integral membrane protein YtvI
MNTKTSPGKFQTHPRLYRFFVLSSISLFVYLVFRYLLIYLFPFLFAYLMMRVLFPVIRFLKRRWHFPDWLAYGGTLFVFFFTVWGGISLLGWELWKQVRLFLSDFPTYRSRFLQAYSCQAQNFCSHIDTAMKLSPGTSLRYMSHGLDAMQQQGSSLFSNYAGSIVTWFVRSLIGFVTVSLLIMVSMAALCKDMRKVHAIYRGSIFYPAVHPVAVTLKKSGVAYIKSQGIILLVIWFLCTAALLLIQNPYSILLGGAIALFDTFPVLGSGMIFVPWAVYELFCGKYYASTVLFAVFLLCVVVRDLMEAHLMGNNMGLLPFFMTAALYIGVCLFGVWGILLGPFGVILIQAVYRQMIGR